MLLSVGHQHKVTSTDITHQPSWLHRNIEVLLFVLTLTDSVADALEVVVEAGVGVEVVV